MPVVILLFGAVSGLIVAVFMFVAWFLLGAADGEAAGSQAFGYLTMLIALSMIFLAIKRYRDRELGGVISFWRAALIGLGVAGVASLFYAAAWEVVYSVSGEAWMASYLASESERLTEAIEDPAVRDARIAELESMMTAYRNWYVRIPFTLVEILPVGLLITLISAGLLRNPRLLPARR